MTTQQLYLFNGLYLVVLVVVAVLTRGHGRSCDDSPAVPCPDCGGSGH